MNTKRRFHCLSLLGSLCLVATVLSQAQAQSGDANALMLAAAKTNGLSRGDAKPWHLKASWRVFNDDGSIKSEGNIEEFWVSPTKYKAIYTNGDVSHSEYGTDQGTYTAGRLFPDLYQAWRLQHEWLEPMPDPQEVLQNSYELQERETGGIRAVCVQKGSDGRTFGPTWCLDRDTPELRITANGNSEDVLHSNPISFQGHTIARDLKFSGGELKNIASDKGAFSAHLDVIEPLTTIDDAAFVPPADAHASMSFATVGFNGSAPPNFANPLPRPKTISISEGTAVGILMQKVQPEYPADAKAAGISGTVVLEGTIDIDGRVENLRVLSGPPMLQQAALNAVRQWVYRPYLLNGQAIEVETTVNVVFTLGG